MNHTISAIGIDIGGTNIKAAAFAEDGSLVNRWIRPTCDVRQDGIPPFAKAVRELLAEIDADDVPVGLAAPGIAARDGRSISFVSGKMYGLEGLDWTDFLGRRDPVPVLNDGHAALLGEAWCGAAVGHRDAILLTLGTGVGGAIMVGGRLLKGALGRAGHLGHVSVDENDERSIFGMPGALEIAIGNSTVAARSEGRFSSSEQLVEAVRAGEPAATAVWLKSIRSLARALASFINILDPEVIIIGGGIALAGDTLFKPLAAGLDAVEWRPRGHRVPILPAQLGDWAGTCGAAFNAIRSTNGADPAIGQTLSHSKRL